MPSQGHRWSCCCIEFPAEQIIYFSQVLIAYVVIIVSLVNLTLYDVNVCLWSSLASGTIGYLLPNPSIRHHDALLPHTTV